MNTVPDWDTLTQFALDLAEEAAKAILPYFRANPEIDTKPDVVWDPVTEADRAGERAMRKLIETRYPDHGINGEEYGVKPARSSFTWVLDPVDGTRAFICGMPTWTTLIGLNLDDMPKVGVMNQPHVGECFYGNPAGAWCNYRSTNRRLRVKGRSSLKDAIFATTAPELYRSAEEKRVLAALSAAAKMTRYGGDAYFFSMVACGSIDIAMDARMQAYDIAPLIPIIEGAGGCVASWNHGPAAAGGNITAASHPDLLAEVQALIADAMA